MRKTVLLIAVLLIALTACETRIIMPEEGAAPEYSISVQGSSEFEVAPDLAKLRFRIVTESKDAQEAQVRNREISSSVESALLKSGVRRNEIETTDYRIEKIQEWDRELQRSVDKGFRVNNAFVVSTTDIDNVGLLIDAGVQAGANNVDSINFELSDAKQKEVKTQALRKATQNAREKAEALADGAGVRVGKLLRLSESSFSVMPYPMYDMMETRVAMADAAPPTEISPQSVQINAQVSAAYAIG